MFTLNKKTRNFLQNNFITFRNGFVNEGLIEHEFDDYESFLFNSCVQLEKLYFEAIKRNIGNRNITINLIIWE